MTFLGQTLSMYLGGILETILGPRLTGLIGVCLITSGTFMSSYCTHLEQLLLCQAVVGIGVGIAYSAPITCGFKHFPSTKGIVTGIITTGTGIGPFIFNFLATSYVNPGNAFPMDAVSGLYRPDSPVVQKVPGMYRMLALFFGIMGVTGALLLSNPTLDDEDDNEELVIMNGGSASQTTKRTLSVVCSGESLSTSETTPIANPQHHIARYSDLLKLDVLKVIPDVLTAKNTSKPSRGPRAAPRSVGTMEMIRDPLFWLVIACKLSTCTIGLYVVATYKSFGRLTIPSDHFLTFAGSLAILSSAIFRSIWGTLADKLGTFQTIVIVSYAYPILLLLYTYTSSSEVAFAMLLCSLLIVWGSHYALYPSVAAVLFGEENMGPNYGVIYFVFGLLSYFLIDSCGYTNLSFHTLNLLFVLLGCVGGVLATILKRVTKPIKDAEAIMKHHRGASSIGSIIF